MGLRRKRKRNEDNAEVPMTPMIDVVFQLLIYFVFTMKPVDVVAHLDVFRPQSDTTSEKDSEPPKLIRIEVSSMGWTINDKRVSLSELERLLFKLASFDRGQTIMIQCTPASPHANLIHVLDLCAKAGLNNLSVVSMNEAG